MQLFKHPSIVDGRIHFEDQAFDVRACVVECPRRIGEDAGWAAPTQADMEAYGQPQALQLGGPTLEEFLAAGYLPEHYPPAPFAEQPSPGLEAYRKECADTAAAAAAKAIEDRRAAIVKVLEGTVADVEAALDGPVEGAPLTLAEITTLQTAELTGKNRKGVMELLELHGEALAADRGQQP